MLGLMSAGLGYIGSALGSSLGKSALGAAANIGGDYVQGVMSNYFGKKSSKYSAKQNYHYQRKLNQWLIPYQLEQQNKYTAEYQEMYSRNSPSWNVAGLRKAGLNPILAASGGFSSTPVSRPSASVGSTSGTGYQPSTRGSVRFDPITLKQLQLMDEQIKGQKIKNKNDERNMGLSGRDATYARIFNEVKSAIGDENFGKLSKGTLDAIKSLFDSPDKYSSLFNNTSPSTRPNAIPDTPLISEDTPPSMAVYTVSRPNKPYYDNRERPRAKSIAERAILNETLKKREATRLRSKAKKVFYFNDEFDKIPHWRKHLYR